MTLNLGNQVVYSYKDDQETLRVYPGPYDAFQGLAISHYLADFEDFFVNFAGLDEHAKIRYLMKAMGPAHRELFASIPLPRGTNEQTYANVKAFLLQHFQDHYTQEDYQAMFYSRKQKVGEHLDDYLADLRKLGRKAFGDTFLADAHGMLKSQFIKGIADPDIIYQVKLNAPTTIEGALRIAKNAAAAARSKIAAQSDAYNVHVVASSQKDPSPAKNLVTTDELKTILADFKQDIKSMLDNKERTSQQPNYQRSFNPNSKSRNNRPWCETCHRYGHPTSKCYYRQDSYFHRSYGNSADREIIGSQADAQSSSLNH